MALSPAIIAALISGASSLVSSGASTGIQASGNQKQRDWASSEREAAQEYNSAEAQKARDFAAAQQQASQDFEASMQEDAQAFNASMQEDAQAFNSAEAQKNRVFQSKEAELAFQRERDFYEEYQSIGAQMRQYRDNGLNPALMYGGVSVGSTPSSPAAAGSAASSGAASSGIASSGIGSSGAAHSSPISAAMASLPEIADIGYTIAQIRNLNAQSAKTEKETSWIDTINSSNVESVKSLIAERQSNIEKNAAEINQISQSVAESIKRCSVMDSSIKVNDSVIDLNLSQKQLNEVKAHVENLNAESIKKMLPYIEARQEAEIAFTNAKTEESKFMAEQLMYEANLKMLKGLVEADLISKGYYDSIINEAGWSAKQAKRNYKWTPVNNLCTCFRDVCIGASSIVNASGSLLSGSDAAPYLIEGFQ